MKTDPKQGKKLRNMLLIGLIGVGFLLGSSFFEIKENHGLQSTLSTSTEKKESSEPIMGGTNSNIVKYEHKYEVDLADILGRIVGVDDVSVVVNLESTEEDIVQIDEHQSEQVTTETDTKGGNRSIRQDSKDKKPTFYRNEKGEQPLVVKKIKPKVRGVLVVARGVENLQVKAVVIEAIQRTLDVPLHRISVLPKG